MALYEQLLKITQQMNLPNFQSSVSPLSNDVVNQLTPTQSTTTNSGGLEMLPALTEQKETLNNAALQSSTQGLSTDSSSGLSGSQNKVDSSGALSKANSWLTGTTGGQITSAGINLATNALNTLAETSGEYADRDESQKLNSLQKGVRSNLYSGLSMIPGVGTALSSALQLTDAIGIATGGQMSNIDKDAGEDAGISGVSRTINNVMATIPGLGSTAGWILGKSNEFNGDVSRVSSIGSAYDLSSFDSADALSGSITLNKGKINSFLSAQQAKLDTLTGISDKQSLIKAGASTSAADLYQQNKNKYSGNSGGPVSVGKEGMKLDNLAYIRELLNKRIGLVSSKQQGGKTEKPRSLKERTLNALKTYGDLYNPPFIQRANNSQDTRNVKLKDGSPATHYLAAEVDENGNWYVFPQVQEVDGNLQYFDLEPAMARAIEVGDYLPFDNGEDAVWFTENYKKAYPLFLQRYQKGGKLGEPGLESNVIVEGAYHAHKNHLDDVNPSLSDMTPKGIPVTVQEEGEEKQVAEIERKELILTKELTQKIEALYLDGSDEAALEAGKLFAEELFNNTIDNTEEVLNANN